jgi:hypothetical protein
MARACWKIAYNAAHGKNYLLGGLSGNQDCPTFQQAFESTCCSASEAFAFFEVCEVCATGIADGKE